MIKDDGLIKKYNEIWKKVKNNLKIEFDSEPVYDEKYLKAKINYNNGEINTNFHNNEIPEEDSECIWLLVILIDSAFRTDKKYYPQVFLEECKYVIKEKKIPKFIIGNIEIYSDSAKEDSDEENSNEKNSDEENSGEKNSGEENSNEKKSHEEN